MSQVTVKQTVQLLSKTTEPAPPSSTKADVWEDVSTCPSPTPEPEPDKGVAMATSGFAASPAVGKCLVQDSGASCSSAGASSPAEPQESRRRNFLITLFMRLRRSESPHRRQRGAARQNGRLG